MRQFFNQMQKLKSLERLSIPRRLFWSVMGGLLSLAVILLLLSPAEKTLGEGIRSVYLHVAFTWTGLVGIGVSGLIGIGTIIRPHTRLVDWMNTIGLVALIMFAIGLVLSILAAAINWGAVFWQEPRTAGAMEIIALGVIVQFLSMLPIHNRIKGLLFVLLVGFTAWSVSTTPRVLHPGDAARTSASTSIRLTFFGLFAVVSAVAAWIVVQRQSVSRTPTN
jgi:hypothetical protein